MNLREYTGLLPDVSFTHISVDSKRMGPAKKTLFICLTENAQHQAEHVSEALKNGAVHCLGKDLPSKPMVGLTLLEHFCFQETIGKLSCDVYKNPTEALALFGVTGTNGKTTTAWCLYQLLNHEGKAAFMGTIGAYFNNDFMPIPWTTPESPVLQELVATHGRSARYLSMEVSSHGVKEKRIYGCRFRGLAFTNLTQDHLDYHRTFDDYYDTKKRFFTEYAKPEGSVAAVAVQAPYGNRLFHDLQRENPTLNLVSVGLESQEKLFDFHARVIEESLEGTTFELAAKGQPTHRLKTSLVGRYNVSNVTLAAALAVRTDSLPWHRLPEAIEKLAAPPGRLERVRLPKSPNIFVDYAHTPDALENVLKLMRDLRPKGSRTVVVFGCGGNRDTKKRPEMGRVAAQLADEVVLTSDNSRSERPEDIIADIEKGIQSQKVHRCPDRREALATAYRLLHPGDVLIVAGKGHETTQTDQQGTRHFSDTEELKRLQHD